MKKVLIFLLTILLPCFLFLELWASYRYNRLASDIKALETEQAEWVESNKKLLTGIAVYSSPDRIMDIAEHELNLVPASDSVQIVIENRSGGGE